jgi:acetyl-CoA synthetase
MLRKSDSYAQLYQTFQWDLPTYYNIGIDICDRHADGRNRPALIYEDQDGRVSRFSFDDLSKLSNRFANALRAFGMQPGDRVGILLPQCPQAAIAHIAVYKCGGIAIPLFTLFGTDALHYRLTDSETAFLVTDEDNLAKIVTIAARLPHLKQVFTTGPPNERAAALKEVIGKGSPDFAPVRTRADDPALIIYTSGTTGPPKGALHAHRTLLGHLPGVELPHNFFPQPQDLFWTPADWAWIGGLIDVLFPSWHHGIPVLAHRPRRFDPEFAFHLMAKYRVRNAFIPPTALKLMRQVKDPRERFDCHLRSIGSGGETLGQELLEWGREQLAVTINEFYGQTEANLIVGNCGDLMSVHPGSMGRAIPGHRVAIIDDQGKLVPAGQTGHIAVAAPDPVMFLEYWHNPDATQRKFVGSWCLTGDMGRLDVDDYFWFVGRSDDLITSSGYRIGPGEIEDCLIRHPAIAMAAVVGKPDPLRTEIIKAFVVAAPGIEPKDELVVEIQSFVRSKLAAHEYPREIEFVDNLPMTATGKIIRKKLRDREING